ncbi:hypothetical protein LCM02_00335 [Lutimonas saemankumensis]|uniref:hypothetical protein n=1 Tax=Lutimonas saemankumensis TaxID=483016 RepID=UPI001CD236FB|nr:hypothetical protein [Lutimonas saemankumensis]MCA0930874.1 hypothetical protein [Lutimonas saemankumensis]
MVGKVKNSIICILLFFVSVYMYGQSRVFSEIKVNKNSAYVGEPIQVSVGIYTSTWFTSGVNFGNIKVNGAFTVYFRSVSVNKQVNGKNYAGVEAIYNVFPYDDKDLVFPSLELIVETPNEGDYKGIKRKVITKEREIDVKDIPKGFDKDNWLVSSNVYVNETWQGNLTSVKVGDVVEREILRKASGTVAELIPPIVWDSINNVSLYPTRPAINTNKSKTAISSSRSEGVRYLFEKEGTVILPEITVTWWNSRQQKLYKKTIPGKTIEVLPNPDLGMLDSVRDSLLIASPALEDDKIDKSEEKIFGLTLKEFLTLLSVGVLVLLILYRILKWLLVSKGLLARIKNKREAYLKSEKYYFQLFLKQVGKKDNKSSLNALYKWIDHLELKEPTLVFFAHQYGSREFRSALDLTDGDKNAIILNNLHGIKEARKNYLKGLVDNSAKQKIQGKNPFQWINP